VVQAGGAIELRNDGGQLEPESPLVASSAGRERLALPAIPPRRYSAGERLDDQHAIACGSPLEEIAKDRVACRIRELVERERRENQRR
jgi:hypothetical protein